MVLTPELRVRSANESFYRTFQVTREDTEGQAIYDLGNRQWDIPELRRLLEEILPQAKQLGDFVVEHEFETVGRRIMTGVVRWYGVVGRHISMAFTAGRSGS